MTDGDMLAERVRVEDFGFNERPDYEVAIVRNHPGAYREPTTDTIEAWECPRCAAITADPIVHMDWHDKVGA